MCEECIKIKFDNFTKTTKVLILRVIAIDWKQNVKSFGIEEFFMHPMGRSFAI